MDEMRVELPLERLVGLAAMLGSMETDLCPPIVVHECWLKRGLDPYTEGPMPDHECVECWLRFFFYGD